MLFGAAAFAISVIATPLFAADSHPLAPQVSFSSLSGDAISLGQLRGSVILLNFWTTTCGVCLSEIPTLSALQNRYGSAGLRVIGVALDENPEAVHRYTEQHRLNYTIAIGSRQIEERFGTEVFPVTFIIGRDGRIYSRHTGAVKEEALESEVAQLLAADGKSPLNVFRASTGAEPVNLPTAEELESEVPGVDVSHLTQPQLTRLKQRLDSEACPCGCNRTVLKCLSDHSSCEQSKRVAQEAAEELRSPMI
jgi:thiol-disulfide isomerase/thioredoxin